MIELQSQLGMNSAYYDDGGGNQGYLSDMWTHQLEAGVQTDLSITYDGTYIKSLDVATAGFDTVALNVHGNHYGGPEGIWDGPSSTYFPPTMTLVDGTSDASWLN